MVSEHRMSERHACALVGLSRDTYRHEGQTSGLNMELHEQIVQTAHARRRWGYRMIHDVLRPHYPGINHKRVYRICGRIPPATFAALNRQLTGDSKQKNKTDTRIS